MTPREEAFNQQCKRLLHSDEEPVISQEEHQESTTDLPNGQEVFDLQSEKLPHSDGEPEATTAKLQEPEKINDFPLNSEASQPQENETAKTPSEPVDNYLDPDSLQKEIVAYTEASLPSIQTSPTGSISSKDRPIMECLHCRRVFISEASFRNKEIHFCKFLEPSTLTTPPLLDKGELDSKGELSCILCGQLRDSMPIFASKEDLKKHILFGHTAAFVILKDLKAGSSKRPKVTSFPAPCVYCSKADASTVKLIDWEQAVLHVGIDHDKLFHALKHRDQSKHTNDEVLMKEFYPAKLR